LGSTGEVARAQQLQPVELEAKALNFSITLNYQLSVLADGLTKLPSVEEINEVFSRNDWAVYFKAVVVQNLHTQLIGGTVFLKTNNILQDFSRNTIHIASKYVVPSTSAAMLLPIKPQSHFCKITSGKTLLPGQSLNLSGPFSDHNVVAVEPADGSNSSNWPQLQLCAVTHGSVSLRNNGTAAIILGKDIKQIQVRPTSLLKPPKQSLEPKYNTVPTATELLNLPNRTIPVPTAAVQIIESAHAIQLSDTTELVDRTSVA
jgi:hypothetical protein